MLLRILILTETLPLYSCPLAAELNQFGLEASMYISSYTNITSDVLNFRPDLIIADLNGGERKPGLEQILHFNNCSKIPFIFFTQERNKDEMQAYYAAKPLGVLAKPYKVMDVTALVEIARYRNLENLTC